MKKNLFAAAILVILLCSINGVNAQTAGYPAVQLTPAYAADTGSVNVLAATVLSCPTAYSTGASFKVLPGHANTTTTPTLNFCGLGAKTITKYGQSAVAANDLTTTAIAEFVYDGTYMELENPQTVTGGGTVTVVSSGSLTSSALVTGGGSQTLQTVCATCTLSSAGVLQLAAGGSIGSADTGSPALTFGTSKGTFNQPLYLGTTSNQLVTGTSTNLTTSTYPASSGAVTLTFPNTTEYMVGANSDTTTTHVLHATGVAGVGSFSAIATGDLPTIPIAGGGTNATSASAGQVPNSTSGSASSWTSTITLGASGTLGSVTMGNASTGTLTVEPSSGTLGTITEYFPTASGDTLIAESASDTTTTHLLHATATGGIGTFSAIAAGDIGFTLLGDTLYGGASGAPTKLAGPTAGAGTYALVDVTVGASAVAPTWSSAPALSMANMTGLTSGQVTGACTTCVTSASSLTSGNLMTGAGSQGAQVNANVAVNSNGAFTQYDGITTAGIGVPAVEGVSDKTAQSASITSTNLIASTGAAGHYLARFYIDQNALCTTGTGSVYATLTWTDASASHTASTVPLTLANTSISSASGYIDVALPFWSASGDAVSYTATYASCTSGTGTYDLHAEVERTN
jgi:hypothetical protein